MISSYGLLGLFGFWESSWRSFFLLSILLITKTYKGSASTKISRHELQICKHDNVERERRNLKGNAVPQLEKADLQILKAKMLKRAQNFVWP